LYEGIDVHLTILTVIPNSIVMLSREEFILEHKTQIVKFLHSDSVNPEFNRFYESSPNLVGPYTTICECGEIHFEK
jgi:hypothetical protein